MSKYYIAIPSYKRSKLIQEKTLKLLNKYNIDKSIIYIFVADDEEHEIYKLALPEYKIIVGELGITNQRNFIRNYFKEGDKVLFIDDDVEQVLELDRNDKLVETPDLNLFINYAFDECIDKSIYLWGIYPVANPYFMKSRDKFNHKLSFIIGTLYGQIIRHSPDLNLNILIQSKEDVLNSILHFKKDKILLRFDHHTIKTKFYNKIGGLGGRRDLKDKLAAEYLESNYSNFGKLWIRKDGRFEFKLKPNLIL